MSDARIVRTDDLLVLTDGLSDILASVAPLLIVLDRELRVRRTTAEAGRLLHVTPAEIGLSIDELSLPDAVSDLKQLALAAMDTLTVSEREVRDDAGHSYLMVVRPCWSAKDCVDGAVIVFRHLEARGRRAQHTEQTRRYLLAIVEALPQPLLVLDSALRVRAANRAFHAAYQAAPAAIEGHDFFELDDGGWDIPEVRGRLQELVARGAAIDTVELEHDFSGVGRRTVGLSARRLDFGDDGPFVLVAVDDVTVARRIDRYERVLAEVSGMVTVALDGDTLVQGVARLVVPMLADWVVIDTREESGACRRVCVLHRDAAMQQRAHEISMAAFAMPSNPVHAVFRTGTPFLAERISPALRLVLAPGTDEQMLPPALVPRSIKIVPLATTDMTLGAITLISVTPSTHLVATMLPRAQELGRRTAFGLERIRIHRDMSLALDTARTANEAKARFLANMSHELRTPLNAILGYEQLLQMELHGPLTSAQKEDLQRIASSQSHLTNLIDDILSFAKLEAGSTAFHPEQVKVDDVVTSSLDMIATQLQRKDIHYEYQRCSMACSVFADPARLQQVIVNLLSNATKFTNPGGRVTVACAPCDSAVEISVTDTGIGIPEDKHEEVFKPFVQLDNALTRRGTGTGLGLAISRDLARAMGGELVLASAAGEGAKFTLILPRGDVGSAE